MPGYVDFPPHEGEFENVGELLELDFVKRYKENPIEKGLPFYRYSKDCSIDGRYLLMIEWKSDTDHKWWVVGYLDDDVDLPLISYEKET